MKQIEEFTSKDLQAKWNNEKQSQEHTIDLHDCTHHD